MHIDLHALLIRCCINGIVLTLYYHRYNMDAGAKYTQRYDQAIIMQKYQTAP